MLAVKVRVNLPNGDMVGHTGDVQATIVACQAADEAVKVSFLCSLDYFVSMTNIKNLLQKGIV